MMDFLKRIINRYGVPSQIDMVIEECSELTKALLKMRRNTDTSPETVESLKAEIITKIADVSIMLEQLKIIFDCDEEVNREIDYKLKRQLERIKNS